MCRQPPFMRHPAFFRGLFHKPRQTAAKNRPHGSQHRQLQEIPRHKHQHTGPYCQPCGGGAAVSMADQVHIRHAEQVENQIPQQAAEKQPDTAG